MDTATMLSLVMFGMFLLGVIFGLVVGDLSRGSGGDGERNR